MVIARYTYFFDIKSEKDKITRINVNYGGRFVQSAFQDYFTRFKYFKPGSVKVNIKPCATLPIDPAGLSYEAGQQTVDPRDMFALGMVRVTNGEQIPDIPPTMSAETAHSFYDNMMLDRRWYKFSPHKGLVKSAVPKYWSIAQLRQDKFPGQVQEMPGLNYGTGTESGTVQSIAGRTLTRENFATYSPEGGDEWSTSYSNVQRNVQFMRGIGSIATKQEYDRALLQNGLEPIRFMPTDEYVRITNVPSNDGTSMSLKTFQIFNLAECPQGQLMVIFLPPSYKTFSYFRIWITETYIFKGYVNNMQVSSGIQSWDNTVASATVDRYIRPYNGIQQVQPWAFTSRVVQHNLEEGKEI